MCFPMNKCCCCFNLNTGAKLIAVLSLLSSFVLMLVYGGAALSLPYTAHSKHTFYLMIAAGAVGQAVIGSLLVFGVFWRKPLYLWPWLVTSWMSCGCLILLSLLGVILLSLQYFDEVETSQQISTMSTYYFVYAVILYYCALVMNSRRRQMLREENLENANHLMQQQQILKGLIV